MRLAVKICGLTSPADVADAAKAGADALGFVLARSPRRIGLARLARLLPLVPAGLERIVVLRQPEGAELQVLAKLELDGLQADALWFEEHLAAGAPELARWLDTGRFALPVFADSARLCPRVSGLLARLDARFEGNARSTLGRFIVDRGRRPDGAPFGTLERRRAARAGRIAPLCLAGGLNPHNVSAAVARVRPASVDVSSGVERRPGQKDAARMLDFVAAARAVASTPLETSP